jgi:hypothetical protein
LISKLGGVAKRQVTGTVDSLTNTLSLDSTLGDLLNIAKRQVSVPVVGDNDIANNLEVDAAVKNLLSTLGGVAKRDISAPVVGGNSIANNLEVDAAVKDLISKLGGVAN